MTKNKNTLAALATAGLIGAALTMGTAAQAQAEHRCNADGCWTVACDAYTQQCTRVWDQDRFDHRYYSTNTSYYDPDRSNGYYAGNRWVPYDQDNRRAMLCDAGGGNCHRVYESY